MNLNQTIFKSYDIRGVYPAELNKQTAKLIAQGFLKVVSQKLNKPIKELNIVISKDIRESSEPLMKMVVETFLEYGVRVSDIGLASINDFYFAAGFYKYDGGIMATASHNPAEYGGFKMVTKDLKVPDKIEFISGAELYSEMEKIEFPLADEKVEGKIQTKEIAQDHLKHILSFIDAGKVKPFKVVVDAGGGMMGPMIQNLFKELPGELIPLFFEYNNKFSNRPPNPLDKNAGAACRQKVLAARADLGVMFDADGDRMFLIDEQGKFITGDLTLILLAKAMLEKNPGAGIVYNLICSQAVLEFVSKWGGQPIRSEVGYRNLARHMFEENGLMSGEVSGHFAFKKNYYADSGFIALVLALQTIAEDGRQLSEIINDYRLYARGDEINIKVDDIPSKLERIRTHYKDNIRDEIDGITVEFPNWPKATSDSERSRPFGKLKVALSKIERRGGVEWWFNVRPSNTEPLLRITVEAKTTEELKKRQEEVMKIIKDG